MSVVFFSLRAFSSSKSRNLKRKSEPDCEVVGTFTRMMAAPKRRRSGSTAGKGRQKQKTTNKVSAQGAAIDPEEEARLAMELEGLYEVEQRGSQEMAAEEEADDSTAQREGSQDIKENGLGSSQVEKSY